ncbi:MAG: thioredoxin family protein, partial [Alphaproteobacteria bacterium]|nr:thioredoxin family protein [Alphaproteobacteria bacterium]
MVVLRASMGFALALTAVWLLWILSAQVSQLRVLIVAALMLLLALFLAQQKKTSARLLAAVVVFVCASAFFAGVGKKENVDAAYEIDRRWILYSPASLRAGLAEGKTVFLNVTADWCLTCKANKRFALLNEAVAERLFYSDVVAMQANWTVPNPEITELLHKYGRYGIPFNIVFGPGAPDGIVLPEVLTPSLVLKAVERAASTGRL